MKIHEMSLRDRPYRTIADGTKIIEMRLFDKKRQAISVGDILRFTNEESGETVRAVVLGLHRFPDFAALYEALLPRVGAVGLGYAPDEPAHPADMLDYYSAERIAQYGVLGIEIRLEHSL